MFVVLRSLILFIVFTEANPGTQNQASRSHWKEWDRAGEKFWRKIEYSGHERQILRSRIFKKELYVEFQATKQ